MSSSGKTYYFNSESNSSRWEIPRELKDIIPTPIKIGQSSFEGSKQNNRINGLQDPEKIRGTSELENTLSSIKIPQIELPYIG
ncbi:hypothetical protein MXB_410 [Myxobolus squamalis]|nr:hypothetical protein MXB_410 [Myxobolus squamalis]